MKRRGFLGSILSIPAIGLAAKKIKAKPEGWVGDFKESCGFDLSRIKKEGSSIAMDRPPIITQVSYSFSAILDVDGEYKPRSCVYKSNELKECE